MKFSVIVPVYNVEKYLADCLDSILNQTYKDFEVIVVNDGSPDNSQDIIDKYAKKDSRIRAFKKKNGGLSDARNYGVKKAKGEYLVFVDSDDTVNKDLLLNINDSIERNVDIIRYKLVKIENNEKQNEEIDIFKMIRGEEAFERLIKTNYFVTACSSAYRRKFWIDNNFNYAVGKLHEDFGLTPYIYMKAEYVSTINYDGYNYYFRDNSITNVNSREKVIKKNEDCLFHYDNLMNFISKEKNVSSKGLMLYKSYIANSLITRMKSIDDKGILKEYLNELKKRNVGSYLIDDTLPRKIKKVVFKLSPSLYMKLFVK